MFNSKDIIVLVLLGIVVYFLTLVMVGKLFVKGDINSEASKELVIFIIGVVAGYLGNNLTKKNGNGHNSGSTRGA